MRGLDQGGCKVYDKDSECMRDRLVEVIKFKSDL